MKVSIIAGAVLTLLPLPAFAADLVLLCNLKSTQSDGTQQSFKARFEFTFDNHALAIQEDHGTGWSEVRHDRFVSADDARIVLSTPSGNSKNDGYVDRMTGEFYEKNPIQNLVIRGTCAKAPSPTTPKF